MRTAGRLCVALCVAAAVPPVSLGVSANGPAWSITASPNVSAEQGSLSDISCGSAAACTAVGYFTNRSGTGVTLAEAWDGTSWSTQSTPNPAGAQSSSLSGVSCGASGPCTAVGDSLSTGTDSQSALAESWSGSSWAIQPTPEPAGARGSWLSHVSCAKATACTAVGAYTNSTGTAVTLAEAWDGTSWSVQSTPNPADATVTILSGVSCVASGACEAVGYYDTSAGAQLALAETWNGTSWAIQSSPSPSTTTVLSAVSCAAPSACTAVGSYWNSTSDVTLAEVWNGSSWTTQATPNHAAGDDYLTGLSCSAATACTAVGDFLNSAGTDHTLAERWNGTSWTIQSTPNTSRDHNVLTGVSCTAAAACTAAGTSYHGQSSIGGPSGGANPAGGAFPRSAPAVRAGGGGQTVVVAPATLAESWDGASWTMQSTRNRLGPLDSSLASVSCASVTACTTVGQGSDSSGTGLTLAEKWNGTAWAIQRTPNTAGAQSSQLSGVSCTAAAACAAVGSYTDSTGAVQMLAEMWDGTSWTIRPTPGPAGATSSSLSAVSCTAAAACTAVGVSVASGGTAVTLVDAWDGTSWTVQPSPNPAGAQSSSLAAVSCAAATACTAVGWFTTGAGATVTLAEAWTGTTWAIQTTPNPAGAQASSLAGVSCTAPTACTAVGSYFGNSPGDLTLAEVWDGTSWAVQLTPNPAGAEGSGLSGVSCTGASACTAVGGDSAAAPAPGKTLAEAWDGTTWAIQSTNNPTGTYAAELSGVSCTGPTACAAVGSNQRSVDLTLAERHQ